MSLKNAARFVLACSLLSSMLFIPAGRFDLPWFWAYLGVFVTFALVNAVVIQRTDASLLEERFRTGPGDRNARFRWLIVPVFIGHMALAGIDAGRWQRPGEFPRALQAAGLAGMAASLGCWVWAISANRFFSGQVRIQSDRGHQVAMGGPYRFVRHPGYLGFFLFHFASPLALGSWWSALPLIPGIPLLAYRTAVEDRMLRVELSGYIEYAARVRYRVLPGVW